MSERMVWKHRDDRERKTLMVESDNVESVDLPAEYLRTHSPSAEVRGHGLSEPRLMRGKDNVDITAIEPIGSYAVQIVFDDGHDSGIFAWSFLYDLGRNKDANLARYAERLQQQDMS